MRNGLQFLLFSALLHVTFSLHEFVYVSEPMNWTNAQKYCRQHYMDLATVDDQEDHDQLLKTVGVGPVWIGLSRTTYPGDFVWSDQSNSSFRKWKLGQPDGQMCVVVWAGFWFDRNSVDSNPVACYVDLPTQKRQIVKLEMKSNENLNDPEVMNKILSEMKQILKEKGLAEDVKLSWRIQSDGNVFRKKDQKRDATEQISVS